MPIDKLSDTLSKKFKEKALASLPVCVVCCTGGTLGACTASAVSNDILYVGLGTVFGSVAAPLIVGGAIVFAILDANLSDGHQKSRILKFLDKIPDYRA
jgi:hypothetical protein